MAYFTSQQDRIDRRGKIAADLFCAAVLVVFSIVFFGWAGGLIGFAILEACLLAVDWLAPIADDAAGVVR
jgi:hypothetical protein